MSVQPISPQENSFLMLLYYDVQTMLNPDSRSNRDNIKALLARYRAGEIALDLDGRGVAYSELTPEQQGRFTMEHVIASHESYLAKMRGPR